MLTTTPHLQTRSPSPTTVQYLVSNAQLRRSLTARVLFAAVVLMRGSAVVLALAFLVVKYSCTGSGELCTGFVAQCALLFSQASLSRPWEAVLPMAAALWYLCLRRYHIEEKLLVMRTLGVQTSTSSSTYLGTATTRFIATSQIQDIFIHEAFIGFEVRYYLAIVVDGEDDVTVVFPNLLPRLAIVEEVWRGTRNCLFESKPKPPKDYR